MNQSQTTRPLRADSLRYSSRHRTLHSRRSPKRPPRPPLRPLFPDAAHAACWQSAVQSAAQSPVQPVQPGRHRPAKTGHFPLFSL